MKNLLLYLILFCSVNIASAFFVNNINYIHIGNNNVMVVGSTFSSPTAVTIPSTVSDGTTTYTVTIINNGAFYYNSKLTSITLPTSVTSINGTAFQGCSNLISITIPYSSTSISIGDSVFQSCTSLTNVTFPNNVTSIGNYAFQFSGLKSVTLPNSLTSIGMGTFQFSGLTSVTLPDSVTSIGQGAFQFCSSLTSITIPSGVTSIGYSTFHSCTSLSSIMIPASVTSILDNAFYNCTGLTSFTINAVTPPSITSNVFSNVTLASVKLHVPAGSLTDYINASVWSGFKFSPVITGPGPSTGSTSSLSMNENSTDVTTFTADEDVTWSLGASNDEALFSIDSSGVLVFNAAPDYESNLHSNTYVIEVIATDINSNTTSQQLTITITDVVETITIDNIIYTKTSATEASVTGNTISTPSDITIPSTIEIGGITYSVKSIGDFAFFGCYNLKSISLPNSVTSIGISAIASCSALINIIIQDSLTSIGNSAFASCSALTNITLPSGVTSIGDYAFYNCTSLSDISLPNSLTSIGYAAFADCSLLSSISLLGNVTSIGDYAFYQCTGLTSFTINAVTPPAINSNVFYNVTVGSVNLYVPAGSKTDYKSASVWSGFKFPPYITSPGSSTASTSTLSMSENSTAVTTFTADETVTWSLGSSNDEGLFSIDTNGALVFTNAPDYETPSSALQSNTYVVEVIATGTNSVTTTQQLTITITDVFEPSTFTIDNITYTTTSATEASVTGNTISTLSAKTIPSTVSDGTTTYSVTSIANYAFQDCAKLTSITLLGDVTSIGVYAFSYCTGLTSITIPSSLTTINSYAFFRCTSLTSISLPSGVTSIGNYVFYGCTGLTSFTINAVTPPSINSNVFGGNVTRASVNLYVPAGSKTAYKSASIWSGFNFSPTITGPGSSTGNTSTLSMDENSAAVTTFTADEAVTWSLGSSNDSALFSIDSSGVLVFNAAPDYESTLHSNTYIVQVKATDTNSVTTSQQLTITITDVVETITIDNIIYTKTSATEASVTGNTISTPSEITIPSTITMGGMTYSVTSIGNSAFESCTSLTRITLPVSVISIGKYAFDYCTNLLSSTLPDNITRIVEGTFANCFLLNNITIPDGVTSIENYAFSDCTGLINISIPDSVTSIGEGAFNNCTNLSISSLPDNLTSIGDYAFSECTGLTSITLQDSVTSIKEGAFYGCTSLTSITIPSGITSIADYAFEECTGLTSFTINAVTPPAITSNVFTNVTLASVNLYVPSGSKTDYKSASVWSGFKFSPTITGPGPSTASTSSLSMNENSTAVTTFTADEDVTWSLGSSNDEGLFSIDTNGALVFTNAPDYETPSSALQSNTYVVEVIATGTNSVTTSQQLTITITNVAVEPITLDNAGLSSSTLASGAYSFRLLGSLYSGPLARITIGSDYYDVYPDVSSNHNFSLSSPISAAYSNYNDVATGATSNLLSSIVSSTTSASVAIWYDQSGYSNDAIQATTLYQPRIINAGVIDNNNGFPAMSFQESTQGLIYSGSIIVQTVNTVRAVADLSYQTLLCVPANTDFSVRNNQSNTFYQLNPNQNDWSNNTNPNYTFVNKIRGATYNMVNNVHTAFIGASSPHSGTLSIGRFDSNNRGMKNGTKVNELLLFPSSISDANRVIVENNQFSAYVVDFLTAQTAPDFQSVSLGGTPTDLTVASGIVGATFQWYSNLTNSNSGGTLLTGEVNSSYTPDTSVQGTYYYYATITAAGITTPTQVVSTRVGIEIITQPSTSTQMVAQGEAVTPISVQASGNNLTYQWYSNGTPINGANASSYTPDSSNLGITYYYVVITAGNTTVTSNVSGAIKITLPYILWNGPSINFEKANYANYTLPINQDFLTNNVKITRGNNMGLFNIATEGGYGSNSPRDTEWAQGTLSDFAILNYQKWQSVFNSCPPCQVGHTFVVHLITDNIYFELTLLSWSSTSGGGFSYSRTTPPCSAPSAPTASSQSFSNAATVADLVATGSTIQWYSDSTGGSALSSSTVLVSGTYYATQTVSCESSRTAVSVTVIIPTLLSNFDSFTVSSGTSDFTINAPTSNSSGAITYTSSNTAVATIVGTTVHLVGPGTTTITATQAADGSYLGNSISTTMRVSPFCGDWGYSLTYPTPLTIGMSYQGGIIFYILQPTDAGYVGGETHGLIAATSDELSRFNWAGAVTACNDKTTDNLYDWYLPNKVELNLMYTNIGNGASGSNSNIGLFRDSNYWSSTEHNGELAYVNWFAYGSEGFTEKSGLQYVRAIRSF